MQVCQRGHHLQVAIQALDAGQLQNALGAKSILYLLSNMVSHTCSPGTWEVARHSLAQHQGNQQSLGVSSPDLRLRGSLCGYCSIAQTHKTKFCPELLS